MSTRCTASPLVDYDEIYLFGDSITEFSFAPCENGTGFGARLANDYARKLDVVNRGFSGANTDDALWLLPQIIPPKNHKSSRIVLMVIFFGANDSVSSFCHQHVSIERYEENLQSLLKHDALRQDRPSLVLVTPPPVCEHKMARVENVAAFPRTAENTRSYAQAAIDTGKKMGVPVINLWEACLNYAGYKTTDNQVLIGSKSAPENSLLGELLYDGLHLDGKGYELLYQEFNKALHQQIPHLDSEAIKPVIEHYRS